MAEVQLTGEIGASASVSAVTAEVGIEVGVRLVIGLNWIDPDGDGKLHRRGRPEDVQPHLSLRHQRQLSIFLAAFLKVDLFLLQQDLALPDRGHRAPRLRVNLCEPEDPQPAKDGGSGVLIVNIGPNASTTGRIQENVEDEEVDQQIQRPGGNGFSVSMFGVYDEYLGFTSVYADGGTKDDKITFEPGTMSDLSTTLQFTAHEAWGGLGNDTIVSGDGGDDLYGDDPAATASGDNQNDKILGGKGVDTINGGVGDDLLNGDDGDDTINGGANNDGLNGIGNDKLFGNEGDDSLDGGTNAEDATLVAISTAALNSKFNPQAQRWAALPARTTWSVVRAVTPSAAAPTSTSCGVTTIPAATASSSAAPTSIRRAWLPLAATGAAGGGNDLIDGGPENDVLFGGTGNDGLAYPSAATIVCGNGGNDILNGDDPNDPAVGNDRMEGGPDNDDMFSAGERACRDQRSRHHDRRHRQRPGVR